MVRGRITVEHRASYEVMVDDSRYTASVRGYFHELPPEQFPKVGDYVYAEVTAPGKLVITEIEPRHGVLSRTTAEGDVQVMVVNVDRLFVVMGLDNDFNVRRLERYLTLAAQSGVSPVIILNKADQALNLHEQQAAVVAVAGDVPVVAVSALTGEGLAELTPHLVAGETVVLLGSSGAGKSTLTNTLLGSPEQATATVRTRDDRGRHTTRVRQLFTLPSGAYLIDTPGMRELGVRTVAEEIEEVFPDIAALAEHCRFTDCDHEKSAGCAIVAACERGEIAALRVAGYRKLLSGDERVRYQRY